MFKSSLQLTTDSCKTVKPLVRQQSRSANSSNPQLRSSRNPRSKLAQEKRGLSQGHGENPLRTRRSRKRIAGRGKGSSILVGEENIIATFIAKVKESKKYTPFRPTYHVIKPRAHLYFPRKSTATSVPNFSQSVPKSATDVLKQRLEESVEFRGYSDCKSENARHSKLECMASCVDEQIRIHQKFISRWKDLLKSVKSNINTGNEEGLTGIKTMLETLVEKSEATTESLNQSKNYITMIQVHKKNLIQVAKTFNRAAALRTRPLIL